MEYKPNALFAFLKTDNSFHGVDAIADANVLRDLILYDIQVKSTASEPAAAQTSGGSLGSKMLKSILRGRR
jgi:hypothetical protein